MTKPAAALDNDGRTTGKACAALLANAGGRTFDAHTVRSNDTQNRAIAASGKLADRPQRRESEPRRTKEDGWLSAQLTWRVLDETSGAGMAANRPAFSLKLPRWSRNLRQRAYNCREFVFKMEIPVNMFKLQCARMRRAAGLVLAVFLAATLHAQTSTAGQSGSAAIDALLAKAGTMYYSTAKAGLTGFDCAVHPDWHTLIASADPGTAVSNSDSRVTLLNGVAITLHARLNGGSTLDWTPAAGSATDADSTSVLTQGHQNTDQTLLGFLGMWTRFMDGSLVPANSSGFDVTQGPSTFTLHQGSNGWEKTEVFSSDLLLEEVDLIEVGISMKTEPTYKATAQGLLVERFVEHIQQMGNPPGPVQEARAGVEYQTIAGFPIPRQLNYKEGGTTMFNMSLDGCTVVRQ